MNPNEILEVKPDEAREFQIADPFNHDNLLAGSICIRPDHRYGALVITSVNDEPCSQVVWATPKMHYPFDRNGDFSWPQIKEAQVWEKLDGTNVLAYHYEYQGRDLVTFKTRLTPVIKDMKYGHFESMWRELLEGEDWITGLISAFPDFNMSFELYGDRNPITVKYNVPLAASFLFGVRRDDHAIKPPSYFFNGRKVNVPKFYQVESCADMTSAYNKVRQEMTEANQTELVSEGVVVYAHTGHPSWIQFKCKSEQIEKIHWANGGIPHNALWTTALNAYENNESPSLQDFIELLKEEYSDSQIGRCSIRIQKIYEQAQDHMALVSSVNSAWKAARENGFDITQDKNGTMRFLSQYFIKGEMRKVGTIILKQAGLI